MLPLAYGETVTIRHAAVTDTDEYGNDVISQTEQVITGCAVWPSGPGGSPSGGEKTGDSALLITGLTAVIPFGYSIGALDQVFVRGALYDVDGEPGAWRSYFTGLEAGTQVALKRVTG